ncbi:hypothetical protein BC826DRAFT_1106031 [Russula brevipes]|nr:hypothetical protein BC826DRAFT_1106031 [Russula brevipes]
MSSYRPIRSILSTSSIIHRSSFPVKQGRPQVTIDTLPDDVLLDAFGFYVDGCEGWQTLVHVCRRWRDLVFASPRRLDLQLLCTDRRLVREMLGIWPALPIRIQSLHSHLPAKRADNILAALEHRHRVCHIKLWDVPILEIWSKDSSMAVLPDSFLGGSAPRLRSLVLNGVPFPTPRKLLLSASHLTFLSLWCLPHSGYISPDAMVACLSSLTRLETLYLGFRSPQSLPNRPAPPLPTRVVVPVLASLFFDGSRGYLEDLVAQIDAPLLHRFDMTFFVDPIFDIPHLSHFLGRAEGLNSFNVACVELRHFSIKLKFYLPRSKLQIRWHGMDQQVSTMALVCTRLSPLLSRIEQLYLRCKYVPPIDLEGRDDLVFTQFLKIFQSFAAVQSLYVYAECMPLVAPVLQGLTGERGMNVLPDLRDLFLPISGSEQEVIQSFVTARQLSGHLITVHDWKR